jgi:hypothetical protein
VTYKFSDTVIESAVDFMQTVVAEVDEDEAYEIVDRAFDAIDPGMKNRVLMYMLSGGASRQHSLEIDTSVAPSDRKKINAIKAIRGATGYGLKEAKEAAEIAEAKGYVKLMASIDTGMLRSFRDELRGTGWKVK